MKTQNVSHQRIFLSVLSTYFVILRSLSLFLEERGFISWFTTPEEQTHVGILFVAGKRGSRHKSVSFCYSDVSKNNGCAFWNFSIALCSKSIDIHIIYNSKYIISEAG
jgi:hypothetical protein